MATVRCPLSTKDIVVYTMLNVPSTKKGQAARNSISLFRAAWPLSPIDYLIRAMSSIVPSGYIKYTRSRTPR